MKTYENKTMIWAFALTLALGAGALAGCSALSANAQEAADEAPAAEVEAAAEDAAEAASEAVAEVAEAPEAPEAVAVDADMVNMYCGMCHFKNVENMAINSWNRDSINFGIVESMIPFADDATIQGIVDYYAAIEPPAQEGGMH